MQLKDIPEPVLKELSPSVAQEITSDPEDGSTMRIESVELLDTPTVNQPLLRSRFTRRRARTITE